MKEKARRETQLGLQLRSTSRLGGLRTETGQFVMSERVLIGWSNCVNKLGTAIDTMVTGWGGYRVVAGAESRFHDRAPQLDVQLFPFSSTVPHRGPRWCRASSAS